MMLLFYFLLFYQNDKKNNYKNKYIYFLIKIYNLWKMNNNAIRRKLDYYNKKIQ